jgi:hypothetical protein
MEYGEIEMVNKSKLTEQEHQALLSEAGRLMSQARRTFGAGTGRPRMADRCPCGEMTRKRALARAHKCTGEAAAVEGGQ